MLMKISYWVRFILMSSRSGPLLYHLLCAGCFSYCYFDTLVYIKRFRIYRASETKLFDIAQKMQELLLAKLKILISWNLIKIIKFINIIYLVKTYINLLNFFLRDII